jgi:rRNA-processing protein FCF1
LRTLPPTTVLLDTSFLLTILRSHLELDKEIRHAVAGPLLIATTQGVIMELQRLSRKGGTSRAGLARGALEVLASHRVAVLSSQDLPEVDSAILAAALSRKDRVIVATVDFHLREILAKHHLASIIPRGHKGLMLSRVA